VKLDDLPSAMIQSVAVTKSLLPSQDANAIAGEVAIRTRTGFDSKKPFFLDGRASVGRYDLNGKSPYEIDGTVGGRFGAGEQFGADGRSTIRAARSKARTSRARPTTTPRACPMATGCAITT
jgi:hypothetical protein